MAAETVRCFDLTSVKMNKTGIERVGQLCVCTYGICSFPYKPCRENVHIQDVGRDVEVGNNDIGSGVRVKGQWVTVSWRTGDWSVQWGSIDMNALHKQLDRYTLMQTGSAVMGNNSLGWLRASWTPKLPPPHSLMMGGHSKPPPTPLPLLLGMCQLHPFPRHPRASGSVGVCSVHPPPFFLASLSIHWGLVLLNYAAVLSLSLDHSFTPSHRLCRGLRMGGRLSGVRPPDARLRVRGSAGPWSVTSSTWDECHWAPKKWQAAHLMDAGDHLIPSLMFNMSWAGPHGVCACHLQCGTRHSPLVHLW